MSDQQPSAAERSEDAKQEVRLLIAGGGTGGHLFPGVAVAEELRARDPDAEVQFVGTARGLEARVLPDLGWKLALIEVSGLKTVGLWGALRGLLRLPRALWQARRLIRKFRPTAVLGVGGYASGPVVLMARLAGIPTAICEQNSIPGLTNKILGKLVRAVFLSFKESARFFAREKVVVSGNPVRRQLAAALLAAPGASGAFALPAAGGTAGAEAPAPAAAAAEPGSAAASGSAAPSDAAPSDAAPVTRPSAAMAAVSDGAPIAPMSGPTTKSMRALAQPPCVLVCGGSLGAVAVNQLAAEALCAIAKRRPLRIVHQTGATGFDDTVAHYRAADVNAECSAFIKDMASVYRQADVIVSRAGATTVAELAMVGKPAIFIPYPYAADNHQEVNAQEMAAAGAAFMFRQADLTATKLADALEPLLEHPERRAKMGAAMKSLAKPTAAAVVAQWCQTGQRPE